MEAQDQARTLNAEELMMRGVKKAARCDGIRTKNWRLGMHRETGVPGHSGIFSVWKPGPGQNCQSQLTQYHATTEMMRGELTAVIRYDDCTGDVAACYPDTDD